MPSKSDVLRLLKPYQGKLNFLVDRQDTSDIIGGIERTHKEYADQYDAIAPLFWKGSAEHTAKAIFKFLKQYVQYNVEPVEEQTLRSPAAIVATGFTKGADCKSYSLFSCGVLDALNRLGHRVSFCYRFASYRPSDKRPHHVFCVVSPGGVGEIWLDPVMASYNDRSKPYKYKIDKHFMALYSLSGVGDMADIGRRRRAMSPQMRARIRTIKINRLKRILAHLRTKQANGVQLTPREQAILNRLVAIPAVMNGMADIGRRSKAERKARRKARPKKRLFLKIALTPARNAFLGLLALNFKQLAVKMYKGWKNDPASVESIWKKLGGNPKKLVNTFSRVAHRKGLAGDMVGFPPLAVLIAAAGPILKKMAGLLKKIGVNSDELKQTADDAIKEKVQGILRKKKNSGGKIVTTSSSEAARVYSSGGGAMPSDDLPSSVDSDGEEPTDMPDVEGMNDQGTDGGEDVNLSQADDDDSGSDDQGDTDADN